MPPRSKKPTKTQREQWSEALALIEERTQQRSAEVSHRMMALFARIAELYEAEHSSESLGQNRIRTTVVFLGLEASSYEGMGPCLLNWAQKARRALVAV